MRSREESGKSPAGYEYDCIRNVDGNYCQKNIRGNHIAVVERGRAGKRAAILDSDTINKERPGSGRKGRS